MAAQILSDANATERRSTLLEKLGPVRGAVEIILKFETAVAELDPRSKAAFSAFNVAWEILAARDKCNAHLDTLLRGLSDILPSMKAIEHATKLPQLQDTIESLWNLIEDASWFIIKYRSSGELAHMFREFIGLDPQEKVDETLTKLQELKETLDRGIGIQTLRSVDEHIKRTLIDKLQPVHEAQYDADRGCMPGTREDVVQYVLEWSKQINASNGPGTNARVLWLYGQAGLGKSAVATSVCQELDTSNWLAASFFCKRDEPSLRDPRRILSTVIFGIASHHPAYADATRKVPEQDAMVAGSPMRTLFDKLVQSVLGLPGLTASDTQHVVVIDALDECEPMESRQSLLKFLLQISKLVPWLRIVVTSRPSSDIQEVFDRYGKSILVTRDLFDYNASDDIYAFIEQRFACSPKAHLFPTNATHTPDVISRSDVTRLLAERTTGLFIWARTACKFVLDDHDPPGVVKGIRDSVGSTDPSKALDALYAKAVEAAVNNQQGDSHERAREAVRTCLGAIIVCSNRTSLSITSLSELFGEEIPKHVLQSVVNDLRSVLYTDKNLGDATRVYHTSFADYLLDDERSGKFSVDRKIKEQNRHLAQRCVGVMLEELRFNICELETSYKRNREVEDLSLRIKNKVSGQLRYSCMHWASHINEIPKERATGSFQSLLERFLSGPSVLYWIEVMSLIGMLEICLSSVRSAQGHYEEQKTATSANLRDVCRFIETFFWPVQESTPHLYISALAFVPANSSLRRIQQQHFPNIIRVESGLAKIWARWVQSMDHDGAVSRVVYSPDGLRIASGSYDNTVRVWNADTGEAVGEPLVGHSDSVSSVAYSPDGRRIVSGSHDKTVRVWDVGTGKTVGEPFVGHLDSVTSVAYSPDSRRIVSGSFEKTAQMWDASTGQMIGRPFVGRSGWVMSVAFSPDGRHIVSGSSDSTMRVWNPHTGEMIGKPFVGHSDLIRSVAPPPDGRRIVSGSDDMTVQVWNADTGEMACKALVGHSHFVSSVTFSYDGCRIVSGSFDDTLRVWHTDFSLSSSFSDRWV